MALQEQLADARSEVDRLSGEAASISTETAQLRGELEGARTAAERYRDLVVRTEPELPPEMIAGNDIDAVEASAAAAREVVERIRARIEGDRQIARIPAGAPPRGGPDVSALSPEQKIRLGLERRAS
jgi:multidrug resistance efflux pump